jgi:hypothetical protein
MRGTPDCGSNVPQYIARCRDWVQPCSTYGIDLQEPTRRTGRFRTWLRRSDEGDPAELADNSSKHESCLVQMTPLDGPRGLGR